MTADQGNPPSGEPLVGDSDTGEGWFSSATVEQFLDGLGDVLVSDSEGTTLVGESLLRVIATPAGPASWTAVADLAERVSTPHERRLLSRAWAHLAQYAASRSSDLTAEIDAEAESQIDAELTEVWAADLATETPGPYLVARLAETDPWSLPESARVPVLQAWHRAAAWLEARRLESVAAIEMSVLALGDARSDRLAKGLGPAAMGREPWVDEELAVALHLTPRAAAALRRRAGGVVWQWPGLREQMLAGNLDAPRVDAIMQELKGAGSGSAGEALIGILADAGSLTTSQLRQRIRRDLIRLNPQDAADQRDAAAQRETGIRRRRHRHGLGTLEITGPAADIEAMYARVESARQAADRATSGLLSDNPGTLVPGEGPTVGQRRLAALLTLLGLSPLSSADAAEGGPEGATATCSPTGPVRPGVEIHVVVDLPTVLGLADNPAHLVGYGPIDPALARALAADGQWTRWVTDPVQGHLLDEGRRRFAGAKLSSFLKARDGTCTTAYCAAAATEADHLPGYARGTPTRAATMAATCAYHNRGRAAAGWEATIAADTSITYRTALSQRQVVPPRAVLPTDDDPPF